jgi:hypothetical protein
MKVQLLSFDVDDILETTQTGIYHNNKHHSSILMIEKADSTEQRYILPDYTASHPRRHLSLSQRQVKQQGYGKVCATAVATETEASALLLLDSHRHGYILQTKAETINRT